MIKIRRARLIFSNNVCFDLASGLAACFRRVKIGVGVRRGRARIWTKFCVSRFTLVIGLVILLLGCEKPPTEVLHVDMDWSAYEKALKHHVAEAVRSGIKVNLVDYRILRHDSGFMNVANLLAKTEMEFSSDNDKLAFYINAYNYYAIKIILDKKPKTSIRDIGNVVLPVWRRTVGQIAGKDVSLDLIEHEILRTMGEPRIHFAIVCASLSCPNLRQELYTAEKLESQLDDQTRKFLNDETKGVSIQNESLHISRIFDWFDEDFERDGGVLAFIRTYREGISAYDEYMFMDYRWELNALEQ